MRRRRLPAEGRPLRGAGRRAAEDRARPAAAVAGHRAPAADALPPRPGRRRGIEFGDNPARVGLPEQPPGADGAWCAARSRTPDATRKRGAHLPQQGLHDQGDREPDGH
ncbi:MAG: histidine kinase, partial [Burkholderiales bacterium]